jgi:hypothetical protein
MTERDLRHKLAAILAADAVDYSRLMAGDDRATVAALEGRVSGYRWRARWRGLLRVLRRE